MPDAWDRMEGEGSRAFAAFSAYLNMPLETRSVAEAYRLKTGNKGAEHASGQWTRWSARYRWRERSEAYDEWMLARQRKALEAERVKMAKKHVAVGDFLVRTGFESLKEVDPKTGEARPVKVEDPSEARQLVSEGVKIIRLALGDTTERHAVDHSGKVEVPVSGTVTRRNVNLSVLTDEQLKTLAGIVEGLGAPDAPGDTGGASAPKP